MSGVRLLRLFTMTDEGTFQAPERDAPRAEARAAGTSAAADRRDAPAWLDWMLEGPRSLAALGQFVALSPLLRTAPAGDGHPVLVLPGFLADDLSTVPLRTYLRRLGYAATGWGLGRNIGPTDEVLDGLAQAVAEVTEEHGRPLSLVGWSLGGIFAREIARQRPEAIRQVVTLGSPFMMTDRRQSRASQTYDRFAHLHSAPHRQGPRLDLPADPLPVPSTSIYTRSDGIVAWQTCVQQIDERSENIEVRGSHCGLGCNAAALLAVSDRLAQAEGSWAPFRPPLVFRAWYPTPAAA